MFFLKFGLVALSMMLFFSTAISSDKKSSFGETDSFGKSDKFGVEEKKEEIKVEKELEKDPKQVNTLRKQIKELDQLEAQAKKFKDMETAKQCNDLKQSLIILADFHEGKKEDKKQAPPKEKKAPTKTPEEANSDCKQLDQKIKKLKLKVNFARNKTPAGKRQRKFQHAARDYYRQAKNSSSRGKKTEAEYYTICGKILDNAAKNYKDKKIEESCKKQLREARNKYLEKSTLESAERFKKRAASMRSINDNERALYYDKVALLKKKMAKAYGNGDTQKVKTLWKEYQELKKTK